MATKEIYLKVKGWFEDKISTRLNSALKKITPMFGKVAQGIGGLTSMLPSMDGALNKVTAGINGLVAGFLSLGPAGVVLAGISVAVGIITDKIYGAAEAAKKLAEDRLAAMQERLRQIKADEIEKLDKAISKAADDADRAAKAFDAMAAAYMKVAQAKDATAAAGDAADISALALERQQAMNAAGSENEAAAIGAGYDVAIAQRRLAAATDQQSAAVERAAEQAADDAERAAASDKAVADARDAYLLALKKQMARGISDNFSELFISVNVGVTNETVGAIINVKDFIAKSATSLLEGIVKNSVYKPCLFMSLVIIITEIFQNDFLTKKDRVLNSIFITLFCIVTYVLSNIESPFIYLNVIYNGISIFITAMLLYNAVNSAIRAENYE